jgi:hypothetical protein
VIDDWMKKDVYVDDNYEFKKVKFDTYKQKGKIIICKNHLNKKEKK